MGHILLGIAKVIGIVLAAVLGLLLFLFFIILFGPVGYEAQGQAEETKKGEARISWFWFVIRYKIRYDSQNKIWWKLRILGIPIFSSEKRQKKEIANQRKRVAKRQKESSGKETFEKGKNSLKEALPVGKEKIPKNRELEATEYGKENKPSSIWKKISEKIKNIRNKIKEIPQKLLRLRDNGKQALERFQEIREYFLGERNKEVIKGILAALKKMGCHILPNRLLGRVEFGLEDPYQMGQILAVLGVLMPIYQDKLEVYPDFEEEKLKGDFSCKGRIIPGYLLFYLLKLLFNKEVRRVIKEGKALIGGN